METNDTNENLDQTTGQAENGGTEQLSHSDKMIGVFTEPVKTFEHASQFPAKAFDWLIPLIVFCVIAIAVNFLLMQNAEIKYQFNQMIDKKAAEVEKQLDEKVKSGEMTEADKETAMNRTREGMRFMTGPVMRSVSTVVFTFIGFFFMGLLYFLISKFLLKGDGGFAETLVARGLPVYILSLQLILIAILSMVTNKLLLDTSVVSFMDVERNSVAGYLISRIDPIIIWFYYVLAIGLSRFFKSKQTIKYFVMILIIWLIGDAIVHLLGFTAG